MKKLKDLIFVRLVKIVNIRYILDVDLKYCKELHNIHNDYPLCPEHIEVKYKMTSNYCKDIVDKYNS